MKRACLGPVRAALGATRCPSNGAVPAGVNITTTTRHSPTTAFRFSAIVGGAG